EQRHNNCDQGRRMITHVRTGSRAGNRNCASESYASKGLVLRVLLATVTVRRLVPNATASAVQSCDRKRLRFALLPGEFVAFHQIQRHIDHKHRALWTQAGHGEIVVWIKAGKWVGPALFV